jgi:hypothetical protein
MNNVQTVNYCTNHYIRLSPVSVITLLLNKRGPIIKFPDSITIQYFRLSLKPFPLLTLISRRVFISVDSSVILDTQMDLSLTLTHRWAPRTRVYKLVNPLPNLAAQS